MLFCRISVYGIEESPYHLENWVYIDDWTFCFNHYCLGYIYQSLINSLNFTNSNISKFEEAIILITSSFVLFYYKTQWIIIFDLWLNFFSIANNHHKHILKSNILFGHFLNYFGSDSINISDFVL